MEGIAGDKKGGGGWKAEESVGEREGTNARDALAFFFF